MCFLEYEPWNNHATFLRLVEGYKERKISAIKTIKDIVRPIFLRRTKDSTIDGNKIVYLPKKDELN